MPRLIVHVEGKTEQAFVNDVLSIHLRAKGYDLVSTRILGDVRMRDRGGIKSWPRVRRDIIGHLKPGCVATTMVDFYGMPQDGEGGWPGRKRAAGRSAQEKAEYVEEALREDLAAVVGNRFNPNFFVPFVVVHEFEGLLFSDCAGFSRGIYRPDLEAKLQAVRNQFSTPEDINDSPASAPSKRIVGLLPSYQKPLLGPLAALEIGLERIRQECPHFDGWLARLESAV